MNISVIIPAKDRFQSLRTALPKYISQLAEDDELLVVDDGSEGALPPDIRAMFDGIKARLIETGINRGPAAARNTGIMESKNPIILFTGDDIYPAEGFVEGHRKAHAQLNDEKCAVLGRTEWYEKCGVSNFMRYITETGGEQFAYFKLKDNEDAKYGFFYTSNISIRRSFLGADMFDEFFPFAAYEDIELGYRLNKRGLKVIYKKDILAYHDHHVTPEGFGQRQYKAGRSFYYFAKKYPELFAEFKSYDFSRSTVPRTDAGKLLEKAAEYERLGNTTEACPYYAVYLKSFMYYGISDSAAENENGIELMHADGSWGIFSEGKRLTSPRNPAREAELVTSSIPAGSNVLFIGAGFGHHVALFARKNPQAKIMVFEPMESLVKLSLRKTGKNGNITFTDSSNDALNAASAGYYPVLLPALKNTRSPYNSLSARIAGGEKPYVSRINLNAEPKVLVISPLYGGSYDISFYISEGFKKCGSQSEVYDTSVFYPAFRHLESHEFGGRGNALQAKYIEIITSGVLAKARADRYDLIFCMAQAPVSVEVVREIKRSGMATAFWFVEDNRLFPYWKDIYQEHDMFFVIQKGGFLDKLKKNNSGAFYLPMASELQEVKLDPETDAEYINDFSLAAAPYKNRVNILSSLRRIEPAVFGDGWDKVGEGMPRAKIKFSGKRLSAEELRKVYAGSAVNLNIHSSAFFDGIDMHKDFVNPRTFEIPASGGFQLVDTRLDLHEFFTDEKEIITFQSVQEMEDKAAYYVKRPETRSKIISAARARIEKEHTYKNRAETVLTCLKGGKQIAAV